MSTKLYHTDIYIPASLPLPEEDLHINVTQHAMYASYNDPYGYISIPKKIEIENAEVIEVETLADDTVSKIVYRAPYSDTHDVCLVVRPRQSVWDLITVWLNHRDDVHRTLDASRYCAF